MTPDLIKKAPHYNQIPNIECIEVVEHFSFNLGNVIKYLWRAEEKGAPTQDLEKAAYYLDREIKKRKAAEPSPVKVMKDPIFSGGTHTLKNVGLEWITDE